MRMVYRFNRGSILPAATMINFIVSQTKNDFRTETLCGGGHPITAIASGPQTPHRERAMERLKRPAWHTQHPIRATKKGRLPAALRSSPVASSLPRRLDCLDPNARVEHQGTGR